MLDSLRNRSGFALLEMLMVVGFIAAITGIAMPMYRDYQIRSDLNLATEQVVQGLARARLLSQAAQNDDAWGFYVPAGILYKGASYENRDTDFDEEYSMPSTIGTTGLLDVTYSQLRGRPSATGAIVLTALNEEQRTIDIEVQIESIAVVENDHISFCHDPGPNQQTLNLPDNAWPAHQAHGDTLGACPGDSSAASSSVASSSSSAAASSSVSSSPCADRFSVSSNGTITTTGPLSVTFTVLGADITYGQGGPEIAVTLKYTKNGGQSWSNLYSGQDVDGGESQQINNVTSGAQIAASFRGYYKKKGWLTFDQTFYSNDQTGHVIILHDGDALPNYPAFANQNNLSGYLQAILDGSGHIDIGTYDLVMLVELGALNAPSTDFQDAILKVEFGAPSC